MLTKSILLSAAARAAANDISEVCTAQHKTSQGCSAFCGFESVKAGEDTICMPTAAHAPMPFEMPAEDQQEYCQLVAGNSGCDDICGYKWDATTRSCKHAVSPAGAAAAEAVATRDLNADPIIGGSGNFRYQYMPDLLKAPAGASLTNCHGLVTDADANIYLTYQVHSPIP
jgi:hypothetical protein